MASPYLNRKGPELRGLFVEVRGFEPLQTEPKSVVLPLHHTSMGDAKIRN